MSENEILNELWGLWGSHCHDKKYIVLSDAIKLIKSLQSQLAASQQREKAAMADMEYIVEDTNSPMCCAVCKNNAPNCEKDCEFEWRVPREINNEI